MPVLALVRLRAHALKPFEQRESQLRSLVRAPRLGWCTCSATPEQACLVRNWASAAHSCIIVA